MSDAKFEQECQAYVDGIVVDLEKCYNVDSHKEDLEEQIDELQEEIDDLEGELEELDDQIFELDENENADELEELQNQYKAKEVIKDTKEKKLDELQDELDEAQDLRDYFDDYLDVDYIVNSNKEYQSARIWVTIGGPGIYIDTEDSAVKLNWGGTHKEAYFSYDIRDAIDTIFEEYYDL